MLRVVSWNVNSINMRLERLCGFLKRESPDLVCLQELKCTEENFPLSQIKGLGYHAAVFGQKAYNGVAILSKDEPTQIVRGFGDKVADDSARFIGTTIGGVTVYSTYVPNGQEVGTDKFVYKLAWLKRLKGYLTENHKPSNPIIVAGDFNVAPQDRDVHDPKVWEGKLLCSGPERRALQSVMDFGLIDTFRLHHSEGGHFSWWDYRQLAFPKNHGLRIDFVLATKTMAEKCVDSMIDRGERKGEKPSDHSPVSTIFKK